MDRNAANEAARWFETLAADLRLLAKVESERAAVSRYLPMVRVSWARGISADVENIVGDVAQKSLSNMLDQAIELTLSKIRHASAEAGRHFVVAMESLAPAPLLVEAAQ